MFGSSIDQEVLDGSNSLNVTFPDHLFTRSKMELPDDSVMLATIVDLNVDVVGA